MLMLQEVEGGVRGFRGSRSFRNAHMCNVNEHCAVLITGFRISLQSITSSVRSAINTEKLQLVACVCVQKLEEGQIRFTCKGSAPFQVHFKNVIGKPNVPDSL